MDNITKQLIQKDIEGELLKILEDKKVGYDEILKNINKLNELTKENFKDIEKGNKKLQEADLIYQNIFKNLGLLEKYRDLLKDLLGKNLTENTKNKVSKILNQVENQIKTIRDVLK